MERKFLVSLLIVFVLSGCGAQLTISDPYGKDMPPGETPTGDAQGNISEPVETTETVVSSNSNSEINIESTTPDMPPFIEPVQIITNTVINPGS